MLFQMHTNSYLQLICVTWWNYKDTEKVKDCVLVNLCVCVYVCVRVSKVVCIISGSKWVGRIKTSS